MRVIILVTAYPSSEIPYAGVFHRTSAEALARRGVEVLVVAPVPWVPAGWSRFNPRWRKYALVPESYEMNGVPVERPRYLQMPHGNHWFWPHLAFAKAARRSAGRIHAEIIHGHFAYPCGTAAVDAGRALGVPTVVTVHGSDVNSFPGVSLRTDRLFCAAIRDADIVTSVGQALAERTHARTGRMPVHLPIGIDLERFLNCPGKQAARRRLDIAQEATVVLYVGNLSESKGIRELIRALESLVDSRLLGLFVGDGPLRQEVQNSPVTRSDGARPNEEMPYYMAAADLLVLPSYGEGLPTVLVEAGAAGLPILATSVSGITELLGDKFGRLVPSRSPSAISQAIREMVVDHETTRRQAERFRCHVKQYYDADRNAARLLELYESAREQRATRG